MLLVEKQHVFTVAEYVHYKEKEHISINLASYY